MSRVEIWTGPERRRRWSEEDKLRILREAAQSDESAASVARRHDLFPQQLYAWRRLFRADALEIGAGSFAPVEIVGDDRISAEEWIGCDERIEIVLRNGRILRLDGRLPDDGLGRLVRVVEQA